MPALCLASLHDGLSELHFTLVGEQLVQTLAQCCQVVHQQCILFVDILLLSVFGVSEIHVQSIFGQAACHQLTVGRDDVSAVRVDSLVFLDIPFAYGLPVLFFFHYDDSGPEYDACSQRRHENHDCDIA